MLHAALFHGDEIMNSRELTFLNQDDLFIDDNKRRKVEFVVGFSILTVAFVVMALISIRIVGRSPEFYEWNAIRLIFPGVSWILAALCATMAYDDWHASVAPTWAIVIYMLQACVAPGIFLYTFVITFLAHRTRSIPFCVVYRGPATVDDDGEEYTQSLVRPATMIVVTRVFALGLLILGLVVNFDVLWSDSMLAGRTGWISVYRNPWQPQTVHIFVGLIPMALVTILSLYFSFVVWRYGTSFSMTIYGSLANPWFSPVLGTCFLIAGQWPGPRLFPILSNSGILLYKICMYRLLLEVDKDLRVARDLANFLDALSDDQVAGSTVPINELTTFDEMETTHKPSSYNQTDNQNKPSDVKEGSTDEQKSASVPEIEEPPTGRKAKIRNLPIY